MQPGKGMHTVALFNHIGGVGKTTIVVNIADAFIDLGYRVLLVDVDPQCTLTEFYLSGKQLSELVGESADFNGGTIWSAIKPVVDGKGQIRDIEPLRVGGRDGLFLCPGDVLLADYEEELTGALNGSLSGKSRDYDVICALSRAVRALGKRCQADIVIYDVGPSVGPLNRTALLDADWFATPVAPNLFSLRALPSIGGCLARWVRDWRMIREQAPPSVRGELLHGHPVYLGYITSANKLARTRRFTHPSENWESKIAARVESGIVENLKAVDLTLTPYGGSKVGAIQNFESLVPQAQELGLAIAKLDGYVNPGYHGQVVEAKKQFDQVAREMVKRMVKSARVIEPRVTKGTS